MKSIIIHRFLLFLLFVPVVGSGQQQTDTVGIAEFSNPLFGYGEGPLVWVDSGHNNFHTLTGRFRPFAALLAQDGFRVENARAFADLRKTDILVISNPIHKNNIGNWKRPIGSAFSNSEIDMVKNWVSQGGRLLLIADHMPFSGATNSLAEAFGFSFCDGFAFLDGKQSGHDVFSFKNNRLLNTEITNGTLGEKVDSITSFTGSAFAIPNGATGVMKFTDKDICLLPDVAWQFDPETENRLLENYFQGAVMAFGKGKIAVFGEAAMFTAQTVTNENGTFKVGFHSENAPNNVQFIRNLMEWLST